MKFNKINRGLSFLIFCFLTFNVQIVAKVQAEAVPLCNITNYQDYIFSQIKMRDLLNETRKGCFLPRINLRGMDLIGASLNGAHLKYANFAGAVLNGADLRGANLKHANFIGANLNGADLRGANLRGAQVKHADFVGAKYNSKTKFPIFFRVSTKGMFKFKE